MEKIDIISTVINRIKQHSLFNIIIRYKYLPIDMDLSIDIVDNIGKLRNSKFCIDDENRFVYENMIRWCHCDPEMKCINPETKEIMSANLKKGIYLAGNTGSGKSWLLDIMSAYAMVYNFQIDLGEIKRCLYWRNIRTDVICDEYTKDGSFEKFKKMNVIGIQDLGSEPTESVYMGNRVNVMRQILEYRGDQTDQITLITSNIPMAHKRFIELYGDRVSSRLNEMCNYFEIKGKDRRKC